MTPQKINVLLVDDDPSMIASLRDVLDATGFATDVAYSGEEAIEKTRRYMPDCILMDIRMPELDGVETFRELKTAAPQCKVIFMTAFASSSLVEEARDEGAVEVLSKPLDLERMIHLIEETTARAPVLMIGDHASAERALGDCAVELDLSFAHNVEDAVLLFGRQPWKAVIVDMVFGARIGMDGLRIIRDLDPHASMILLSGSEDDDSEMRRNLESIANTYFSRPPSVEALVQQIKKQLGVRHLTVDGETPRLFPRLLSED